MCGSVSGCCVECCVCQEFLANEELNARTKVSKTFLLWPAESKGKKKKANCTTCKLNMGLMLPLVGRADGSKRLREVPFLERLLTLVNEKWEVP